MFLGETYADIVLEVVARIQTPRNIASAGLRNVDSLCLTICPRIKSAVLDDRFKIVEIGKMIQLIDIVVVGERLIIFFCFSIKNVVGLIIIFSNFAALWQTR